MNIDNYLIQNQNKNWLITSILYASYNSILLIPVLIPLKSYIEDSKNKKYIAWITAIITIILLITVYLFLINIDVDIKQLEMPAIYAIDKIWPGMKNIYGSTILISIFTTAISLGISFLKNVSKNQKSYNKIAILICITGIVFSKIGFSNLVNLLYPVLGILGIFQFIYIFKS